MTVARPRARLTEAERTPATDRAAFSTCATQLARYQRVEIVGTDGRIEIEIPVNAPADRPTQIWLHRGTTIEEIAFEVCNQYTLQGDAFSLAILNHTEVPTPLSDAEANMRSIDAIRRSAEEGGWMVPSP